LSALSVGRNMLRLEICGILRMLRRWLWKRHLWVCAIFASGVVVLLATRPSSGGGGPSGSAITWTASTCSPTPIVLNVGGGPTDDKPTVRLAPPADPDVSSGFLNLRVRNIAQAYRDWSARGAAFLTEPKDHRFEIRCYMRDPDGYIIEVGQSKNG